MKADAMQVICRFFSFWTLDLGILLSGCNQWSFSFRVLDLVLQVIGLGLLRLLDKKIEVD